MRGHPTRPDIGCDNDPLMRSGEPIPGHLVSATAAGVPLEVFSESVDVVLIFEPHDASGFRQFNLIDEIPGQISKVLGFTHSRQSCLPSTDTHRPRGLNPRWL